MLSGGIFTKSSMRPAQAGRIINTWVGDPHKILMLEAVSFFQIVVLIYTYYFYFRFSRYFFLFLFIKGYQGDQISKSIRSVRRFWKSDVNWT